MAEKIMKKRDKITLQIWLAIFIALSGVVLLFLSFFINPIGVIDPSVLAAIGELLTFSGSVLGIDGNYKLKTYRIRMKSSDNYDDEGE